MRDVRHELEQRTERVLAFGEMLQGHGPLLHAHLNFRLALHWPCHWPPPASKPWTVQTAVMEIHRLRNGSLTCSANRHDRRLDCHLIRPAHPILPAPRLV